MLGIFLLSTAWAPMLAPSRSAVHASMNPVIHVRMSTFPAPEGFAWSSVPELAPPAISTADAAAAAVAVAGSPSDSSSWGPAPAAPAVVPAAVEKKPAAEKKRKPAANGIFAPVVKGAKALMGEEELNKLRGEVIAQHSKVISAFVDTSESPFGQLVIRKMFEAADKDGSGGVDKEELRAALKALGFDFLEEKQVSGILERADTSGDEVIDFEEFVKETPRCAHHRRNPHRPSDHPSPCQSTVLLQSPDWMCGDSIRTQTGRCARILSSWQRRMGTTLASWRKTEERPVWHHAVDGRLQTRDSNDYEFGRRGE